MSEGDCGCEKCDCGSRQTDCVDFGDMFARQHGEWTEYPERFNDNRADFFSMFFIEYGLQHAEGYVYRCKCGGPSGQYPPVLQMQLAWFDCKKEFIPVAARCNCCGRRWRLAMDLSAYLKREESETMDDVLARRAVN